MADIEERLRHVLASKADPVDSDLSGPRLRAIAASHATSRRRTGAQALVAAAAVAVIAIAPQVLRGPEHHRPAPLKIPAGTNPSTSMYVHPPVHRPVSRPRVQPSPSAVSPTAVPHRRSRPIPSTIPPPPPSRAGTAAKPRSSMVSSAPTVSSPSRPVPPGRSIMLPPRATRSR